MLTPRLLIGGISEILMLRHFIHTFHKFYYFLSLSFDLLTIHGSQRSPMLLSFLDCLPLRWNMNFKILLRAFKNINTGPWYWSTLWHKARKRKDKKHVSVSQHNNPHSRTCKVADFAESLNVCLCWRLQCSTQICKLAQMLEGAYTKSHARLNCCAL